MKTLIKFLVMNAVMFIVILGLVTGIVYMRRDQPLPFEDRLTRILAPPDSGAGVDTVLTAEGLAARAEEERVRALTQREEALSQEATRIATQRDSLSRLEATLATTIQERELRRNERITKLAKVYETMRPAEAAAIITELDNQTIRLLLDNMNERQAARIMGALPPERAVEIAESIARQP